MEGKGRIDDPLGTAAAEDDVGDHFVLMVAQICTHTTVETSVGFALDVQSEVDGVTRFSELKKEPCRSGHRSSYVLLLA